MRDRINRDEGAGCHYPPPDRSIPDSKEHHDEDCQAPDRHLTRPYGGHFHRRLFHDGSGEFARWTGAGADGAHGRAGRDARPCAGHQSDQRLPRYAGRCATDTRCRSRRHRAGPRQPICPVRQCTLDATGARCDEAQCRLPDICRDLLRLAQQSCRRAGTGNQRDQGRRGDELQCLIGLRHPLGSGSWQLIGT